MSPTKPGKKGSPWTWQFFLVHFTNKLLCHHLNILFTAASLKSFFWLWHVSVHRNPGYASVSNFLIMRLSKLSVVRWWHRVVHNDICDVAQEFSVKTGYYAIFMAKNTGKLVFTIFELLFSNNENFYVSSFLANKNCNTTSSNTYLITVNIVFH